ncbi:MAG TPA: hypothetical protein VIA18_10235, partial [Polyangia bacterium]|nr:hypothetical protein [Polyangia bacterium]
MIISLSSFMLIAAAGCGAEPEVIVTPPTAAAKANDSAADAKDKTDAPTDEAKAADPTDEAKAADPADNAEAQAAAPTDDAVVAGKENAPQLLGGGVNCAPSAPGIGCTPPPPPGGGGVWLPPT